MEELIKLYKLALEVNADIKQIKDSIDIISQGIDNGSLKGNTLLRTDETVFTSYRYASVRPTTYVKFLGGELKEHEKHLKVIEDKIKRSIN